MKLALFLLGLLAFAGCARTQRTPVEAATIAACRERADQVYERQNRVDLSRRDERDTPYASSYTSGVTTRGLGARFERGQRIAACTSGLASGAGAGAGGAMNPGGDGVSGVSGP